MLLCTQDQWLTARSCQSVPSRWWPWAWSHPCRWRPWPDGGARTGWGPPTWPPSAAQSWTAWSPLHPPVDYPVHKIQNNVILLGLWFYITLYRIGKMTSYCSSPHIDLYLDVRSEIQWCQIWDSIISFRWKSYYISTSFKSNVLNVLKAESLLYI